MKKSFFSALILSAVLFLSSCGDGAAYVNEVIVARADKAVDLMSEVMDKIGDDEYDQALLYLDSVSIHVKESTDVISKLDNKSAEELKKVTLEYLSLFDGGVADFKQAIQLFQSEETSYEQHNKAVGLINSFTEKVDGKLKEAQAAQVEFAKANNIKLQ